MNMVQVTSSSIAAISYDEKTSTLRIIFHAGNIYDYHGVPKILAEQFIATPSKGRFYAKMIKGRFNPVRIQ